MEEDISS